MKDIVCVYLFDGYSDWELSYVLPELTKLKHLKVEFITEDGKRVTSQGGLTIIPTRRIDEVNFGRVIMLLIPGGSIWETSQINRLLIFKLLDNIVMSGCIISAICGATLLLAKKGMLDNVIHTSNDLEYLKALAPTYGGESLYISLPTVTDSNINTANGISPIEYSKEILLLLNIDKKYVESWYQLFKYGIFELKREPCF